MEFAISDQHIHPAILAGIGFIVGVLGGFFGVGGSFLAGPALFGVGVPMNFVIGTDLAHIVGKSVVAARKHRALGHVDLKLGMLMVLGTVAGVELGARLIEMLERRENVDTVVGVAFIVVLVSIAAFIGWESLLTLRRRGRNSRRASSTSLASDESAISHVAARIQRIHLPPMVELPTSGITISLWIILLVGFIGGVFGGFLGGGAGYVRMPMLVYLLGVPTHVAVGTDLFEIVISAGFGTVTHALKGNVDILIALVMHTGAAIGAQIGAQATQYFGGPKIRLAFVPLPLIGAAIVVWKLTAGMGAG